MEKSYLLLSKRYNKKKHTRSFNKCYKDGLNSNKLKINDIDLIEVGFLPERYVKEFLKPCLDNLKKLILFMMELKE